MARRIRGAGVTKVQLNGLYVLLVIPAWTGCLRLDVVLQLEWLSRLFLRPETSS